MIRLGDLNLEPVNDFAALVKMNDSVISRLCREGTLPSIRIGGKWFVDMDRAVNALRKQLSNSELRYLAGLEQKATHKKTHRNRHPERDLARRKLGDALASGIVKREPCEICGISIVEAHHDDYSKHLEVRWLCRKHHLWIHGKQETENQNDQS